MTGVLLFSILLLASCSAENQFTTPTPSIEPSLILMKETETLVTQIPNNTPSLTPLDTASPTLTLTQIPDTPTPICLDGLIFLEDITIPDGTQVFTGDILDKRWKVENSGTCNWNSAYRIKLLDGIAMEASQEQALYPARAGSTAIIRIIYTAPKEPGFYRSAWQAVSPKGEFFGDPIFIDIEVVPQP